MDLYLQSTEPRLACASNQTSQKLQPSQTVVTQPGWLPPALFNECQCDVEITPLIYTLTNHSGRVTSLSIRVPTGGFWSIPFVSAKNRQVPFFRTTIMVTLGLKRSRLPLKHTQNTADVGNMKSKHRMLEILRNQIAWTESDKLLFHWKLKMFTTQLCTELMICYVCINPG